MNGTAEIIRPGQHQSQEMQQSEPTPRSSAEILNQVRLIQDVMRNVMKDKEHYGVIPGCGNKPTLLKAGAEKLSMTFRLIPEFSVTTTDLSGGHREEKVVCTLTCNGRFAGQGVGVASTMESKWRYRSENTGREVPKDYWKTRNPELLGGPEFSTKKVDGQWMIAHKVEHTDPADYYNTVLKMAKKRAHVDAVITATAASDIFTQDVEDMVEETAPRQETKAPERPPVRPPQARQEQPAPTHAEQEQGQSSDDVPPGERELRDTPPGIVDPALREAEARMNDGNQETLVSFLVITSKPAGRGTRFSIKCEPVGWVNTFDKKLATTAESFKASGAQGVIVWKQNANPKFGIDLLEIKEA